MTEPIALLLGERNTSRGFACFAERNAEGFKHLKPPGSPFAKNYKWSRSEHEREDYRFKQSRSSKKRHDSLFFN